MIDLELVKQKIKKVVEDRILKLTFNGTVILSEPAFKPAELHRFLQAHFVYCPSAEFKAVLSMHYTEPHCYITGIRELKGKKLVGVFIRNTLNEPDVVPYFEHERDELIEDISTMMSSIAMVYHKGLFEAYARAFLNDNNAVVLAGLDDIYAFAPVLEELTGGKPVDYEFLNTKHYFVMKVSKAVLKRAPYDTILVIDKGDTVFALPATRDEVFEMLMKDYDAYRSETLEILSRNDELRELIERAIEEAEEEQESNA